MTTTATMMPPQLHSLSSPCGAFYFTSSSFPPTPAATINGTGLLFHFHHAHQPSSSSQLISLSTSSAASASSLSTATARRGCSPIGKRISSFSTITTKSKRTLTPPPPPPCFKSNFSSSSNGNSFFFFSFRCLPPSADSASFPSSSPPPLKEEKEDESSHKDNNADEYYTNNNNNSRSNDDDDDDEIEIEIESSSSNEDGKRKVPELKTLLRRFWKVAAPYWFSSDDISQARFRLAAVFALTLATTGISVAFNFLGRDFYNALANKDQEQFTKQLLYYLGGFAVGIPFFVLRDYAKETLALRWRSWMTKYYMERYLQNQAFYKIQSQSIIDNPDQRIVDDLGSFSGTALSFSLTLFNSVVDLISFSNILYGIYPPLFVVLLVYSLGGTAISVYLGRGLVTLNFLQEKKEADFRYGLVRVRENAESIAFYGGEDNEMQLLLQRFKNAFENFTQLLISSRNLEFFTNGYRYLIQILPAAVVAPMYFSGTIEFGVISQSVSAFNHILGDFSLIVFQFQSISAFSAVIDRLGEFDDILDGSSSKCLSDSSEEITLAYCYVPLTLESPNGPILTGKTQKLLHIENLTLQTPMSKATLIRDLSLVINKKDNMLVMGPSGSGKTSLLRALAGLWNIGKGKVTFYFHNGDYSQTSTSLQMFDSEGDIENRTKELERPLSRNSRGIFFLPQKPYMVLGTLRQQLLYPTWADDVKTISDGSKTAGSLPFLMSEPSSANKSGKHSKPTTNDLIQVLEDVRLGYLLSRFSGLDSTYEWSSVLSLGEQQRLAFARLLLSKPELVLLDESTSALDETNEGHLYRQIEAAGITCISVGHRRTLCDYHNKILHISTADIGSNRRNWHIEPTNRDALSNSLNS